MKPKVALLAIGALLLIGVGAYYYPRGTSASEAAALAADSVPTNAQIRETFLAYVPPGEPGAPHDMEWLVEHSAGDGGYYGTKYFPGSLSVSLGVGDVRVRSYNAQDQPVTHTVAVYGYDLWTVAWNVEGTSYDFFVYQKNSDMKWAVTPSNASGVVVMSDAFG